MKPYDHKKIQKKWQGIWANKKIYKTEAIKRGTKKQYVLDMFPYPSGDGLHVGHVKGYVSTDVYARYKHHTGHAVLHPMGWDAFGLPAENYAIKNKVHPAKAVAKNIKNYKSQLAKIGFTYDWNHEVNTTDPAYYKWTQWIFLQMWKKGLAFESHEPINWCPSCQTGLANEDLEDGKCERCGSVVEKKPLRQWVLRITDYAERLLAGLPALNWPTSIKESQKNWIGRSDGVVFSHRVKNSSLVLPAFSHHFEACYADTFMVIAPDHSKLAELIAKAPNKVEIETFSKNLIEKRARDTYGKEKESEGIFTGAYAIDPLTGTEMPVWVASYAIADYGTGIVRASAHDERDFAFAKKYDIPLKAVLFPADAGEGKKIQMFEYCYSDFDNGILSEPVEFVGGKPAVVRARLIDFLERKGFAKRKVSYKLRDWVFSRQRYWGEPIPLIHCPSCGVVPVPERELPVKLPNVKNYAPSGTGESPLATIEKWVKVKCPTCKGVARRETNTMPQWAGSCWYYLRFIDPKNKKALIDPKKEKAWMPIDMYVGGAEHATRHLIYARFWHLFLYDLGVVSTEEPFMRLANVGTLLGPDNRKMSKRWGNVINPDEVVEQFGADALRLYEMFMGPLDQAIAWSTDGLAGTYRFIERVWRLSDKVVKKAILSNEAEVLLNRTIKKVGEDIEAMKFNTAVSALMVLVNELEKAETIPLVVYQKLLVILSPFAPHVAHELWELHEGKGFVYAATWPKVDETKLETDELSIGVQINGKVRHSLLISRTATEVEVKELALASDVVQKWLEGKVPSRIVYVPGRLLSIVV